MNGGGGTAEALGGEPGRASALAGIEMDAWRWRVKPASPGAGGASPARERILERLRAACRGEVTAPPPEEVPVSSLGWNDFREALEDADGVLHREVRRAELSSVLARLAGDGAGYAHAAAALLQHRAAPVSPRELDGMACLVATGSLAVARTGSVLVSEREVPVRAHLLLPETLVLLVPAAALVDDLPAVYRVLDPAALAGGYFTLVTGPSKTADIEQTLVTGAHGPRRLTVVPVFDLPPLRELTG